MQADEVLYATEMGAPEPTFREFTEGERKVIRKIRGYTETSTTHLNQCPLLSIMLLDFCAHFDRHPQTKPGFKPTLFRSSGFVIQDEANRFWICRRDNGLSSSRNSKAVLALEPLRHNPLMRKTVHLAKLAAHKIPAEMVPNFYARFWDAQNLTIDGMLYTGQNMSRCLFIQIILFVVEAGQLVPKVAISPRISESPVAPAPPASNEPASNENGVASPAVGEEKEEQPLRQVAHRLPHFSFVGNQANCMLSFQQRTERTNSCKTTRRRS
jgi:hypothetical protein